MKNPGFRTTPHGERGIALVAVLAMILVITILVVAFVTKSRTSSVASTSFSGSVAADQLARDAVNNVQADLLGEIEAKSTVTSTDGVDIYRPSTPANILPELDAKAKIAAAAGVPNLLKSGGEGLSYIGAKTILASSIATDRPSLNGRVVSRARWDSPALLTGKQGADTALPHWIYVNRNGPVRLETWADGLAQPTVNGGTNPEFVIGRYAYRVYDISGLLDLNVAGFPNQARDAALIGRKGGLPWLDFYRKAAGDPENPLIAGFDPSKAEAGKGLFAWRGSVNSFRDYVDNFGRRYGFLLAPAAAGAEPSNRFLSRSELIRFVRDESLQSQFPDAQSFLTKATMFSREVNGPVWGGDSSPTASPASLNPFIPDVRVADVFTRRNGTEAKRGEPLLSQRFPLDKLALLAAPNAQTEVQIRNYFGLSPAADGKWDYVAGTVVDTSFPGGERERLKTFAEIAEEKREPNFFEILQAGIWADSLGQGAVDCFFANSWTDTNIARHILHVGVNIIDQYDADDDPTVIARTPLDQLKFYPLTPDPDIAGIENIPYIQFIGHNVFRRFDLPQTGREGKINYPVVTSYFQFQLWNPHRNASDLKEGNFRIVADGDVQLRINNVDQAGSNAESDLRGEIVTYSPETRWISFSLTADTAKFATPHLLTSADPSVSVRDVAHDMYTISTARIVGFWQGDCLAPYDGIKGSSPPDSPIAERTHYERYGAVSGAYTAPEGEDYLFTSRAFTEAPNTGFAQGVSLQLQKFSNGNWLPVQTLPAMTFAKNNTQTEMPTVIAEPVNGQISSNDYSGLTHTDGAKINKHWVLHDPRTIRFGPFHANAANNRNIINKAAFSETSQWFFYGWLAENRGLPATTFPPSVINAQIGQGYKNLSSTSYRYSDRGLVNNTKVYRNGDASTVNPYTLVAGRPIMLNRPFRSVSELSYVFKDLPWKSLNFSRDTSDVSEQPTADAALLDLFSISEAPVRAGTVNLNTASEEVLAALLVDTDLSPTQGISVNLSESEASEAAKAIRTYLGPRESPLKVIRSPADLSLLIQALSETGKVAYTWPKQKREAILAALVDVHNARTWNLLVQVSAQVGRFPAGSDRTLADFTVAGERNLVVHLAIDRYTGKVVDSLVEDAPEAIP